MEKMNDDEEDSLDKYMESVANEVRSFRAGHTGIISTKSNENNIKTMTIMKQEQLPSKTKGSVIKVITKTVTNEVRTIIQ